MKHLLIMGCSATKLRTAGLVPAIERYDGPTWRTLRANMRGLELEVIALSAEHGFIPAGEAIADYDRRLDGRRAAVITHDTSATWVRERVTRCPGRVFLMGGRVYRQAMIAAIGPALVMARHKRDRLGWPETVAGRWPAIGEQMAGLNRWLTGLREIGFREEKAA